MTRPPNPIQRSRESPAALLAATHQWPGSSPCAGTLQACLDGVDPGDTIEVVTETPIDEELQIGQSLTLKAAAGVRPVLPAGRDITTSAPSDDFTVSVIGFTLESGLTPSTKGFRS